MTNKEFKDEVFSRAEKQIAKRKKTIKAICTSALSVALLLLLVPVSLLFIFSNAPSKGDMAWRDDIKEEPSFSQSSKDNAGYTPSGDIGQINLEIFDYSVGERITADSMQKKEIVGILEAIKKEVLQKGASVTSSELDKKVSDGTYRLKITFSEVEFYIGESSVCCGLKELNNNDYLKKLLKIIEK